MVERFGAMGNLEVTQSYGPIMAAQSELAAKPRQLRVIYRPISQKRFGGGEIAARHQQMHALGTGFRISRRQRGQNRSRLVKAVKAPQGFDQR